MCYACPDSLCTKAERDVAEGAVWLDNAKPGWERAVDVKVLDLTDPEFCILGQVFRFKGSGEDGYGYGYGRELVFLDKVSGPPMYVFARGDIKDFWIVEINNRLT